MSEPVLALDIGGTKLAVAVVTADGGVHGRIVEPTHPASGPDTILARLWNLGRRAIADAVGAGIPAPAAVGIGCGGPLDRHRGVLVRPLHLPGWIEVPIVALASEAFGLPTALDNDGSAAARGEHHFGRGRGTSDMLYLTLSTGVGGGAVVGGALLRGASGNAAEFGHVSVATPGRACSCGRSGCLEAYASGTSIADRAVEALAAGRASSLAGAAVTSAAVIEAARTGDALAQEIWDETLTLLARGVTDLVNVFEPELVVLGGGVTRSGEALLAPLRDAVARDALGPAARARIELAALGDDVGLLGAAAVAFDREAARA